MARIAAAILVGLLACASMAHASSLTAVTNKSKCDGFVTVNYASALCSDDKDKEVQPGGTWSQNSGACVINKVSGYLICDGTKVPCTSTSASKDQYILSGNSATCQIV